MFGSENSQAYVDGISPAGSRVQEPAAPVQSAFSSVLLRAYRRIERTDPQVMTGLFCLLIIVGLELLNPHYFFGADNIQFSFVNMTEIARNVVHGENIFHHQHIFGGDFDMRDDPVFLTFWNPLTLLCSLLTLTRLRFWAVDLLVAIYIIAAGWVMARLLMHLKTMGYLRLSRTLVVFLSASYACSGYSLVVGASWGCFAPNIAALPMFLLGLLQARVLPGIAWVCFATLVGLLAGHLDPVCYSMVFVSLFCAFLVCKQRSFRPVVIMGAGVLLALLIASPLLWRAWCGFQTNPRAIGITAEVGAHGAIPLRPLLAGYFMGWFARVAALPVQVTFFLHPRASFLFSFSFSSALLLIAFRHWRKRDLFCHVPLLLALFAILLVVHPPFVSDLIARMPVFRSFTHPLRQLMFFHFFMVLWLAFNLGRVSLRDGAKLIACGLFVFVFSLARLGYTTFSDFGDRKFILSGRAERFWQEVRQDMPPGSVLATVGKPSSWFFRYPLCLAGGNNFPALYEVTMAGGYSPTKPCNSEKTKIPCDTILAFFDFHELPSLLRTYKNLYVIELAPHSAVRLGAVDSNGKFITQPKTINFKIFEAGETLNEPFLQPASSGLSAFTNSAFGDGYERSGP